MNYLPLMVACMRLEMVVVDVLVALGCVHAYKDKAGPVQAEVPPEAASFDPGSGLVWVTVDPQRLPRPYTCGLLMKSGFKDAITERFGEAVEVFEREYMIVVVSKIDIGAKTRRVTHQGLPLAA